VVCEWFGVVVIKSVDGIGLCLLKMLIWMMFVCDLLLLIYIGFKFFFDED